MIAVFQNIAAWFVVYKYPTLFVVAFLSSLGIPLPAGSSTVAFAAFASQGYLNIFAVMIVDVCGNILGDISMYGLTHKYGRKVLNWFHLGKIVESKPLRTIESAAAEKPYSAAAIIISRFQDQATAIVNAIAGLGRMRFKSFFLYVVIGDILQILFYSSIGYFFAANWQAFYNTLGIFSWLIVVVTLIISIIVAQRFTRDSKAE